jgi:hypothetical protein
MAHWSAWFLHLRLPISLVLAPIFLWGYLLSGQPLSAQAGWAFLAVHLFLYGGSNAYNSYYDRDEGPIGGLANPPPVDPYLGVFGLSMKACGALITLMLNLPLVVCYSIFALMSVAYSRSWPRWKAYPWGSLATVALGQGGLAFLMGWWASGPIPLTHTGVLGMWATVFLSAGTYPLTQLYQVSADQARGDQTFAARYGSDGVFILARLGQCLGGACLVAVLYQQQRWIDMGVFSLIIMGAAWLLYDWQCHYQPQDTQANYRRVMHMNLLNGGTFSAYILLRLWLPAL